MGQDSAEREPWQGLGMGQAPSTHLWKMEMRLRVAAMLYTSSSSRKEAWGVGKWETVLSSWARSSSMYSWQPCPCSPGSGSTMGQAVPGVAQAAPAGTCQ